MTAQTSDQYTDHKKKERKGKLKKGTRTGWMLQQGEIRDGGVEEVFFLCVLLSELNLV